MIVRTLVMKRWTLACALLTLMAMLQSIGFGDDPVTNSLGMKLVRVQPGSFIMGSADCDWDERPAHQVTISRPLLIGATEVTNAQYEQFDPEHRRLRGKLGFSTEDDEAVVFVSWQEAMAFCRWLGEKEGKPYRLPSEAEWEYVCRAGTTTPYHTGDSLPQAFHKNAVLSWYPGRKSAEDVVPLHVGKTPSNDWGLYDMHGNVEEWCLDWYGPYGPDAQTDPVGRADGDFRVTRGGSHSTTLEFLRSGNRSGTLPDDKSWLIGFRVVQAEMPSTAPLPAPPAPLNARNVSEQVPDDIAAGPDPAKPYFQGPRQYVNPPSTDECPVFNRHNHCPALVNCRNGDLLAIWYTCKTEPGRELGIVASRLPYGQEQWQVASDFWDAPDRNDHASALWVDEKGTLYHFNGLSAAATWGSLATIMRTSTDHGATWSKARLIMPEHGLHHMPIESVIRTREGAILVPCDAVPGGSGGSAVLVSRDEGQTWVDPGEGREEPVFSAGATGAWIAGIHAGFFQRADGSLLAFGRGNDIDKRMPMSVSRDLAENWTYSASPFPPIGGGQRLVVLRLQEGPILFCSFGREVRFKDAAGNERVGSGLFAALSTDEGESWEIKRLVTDDGPPRTVDGGGNTGKFTMSATSAEPRGYLSICQAANGVIHLISSKQHYAFNLAWLKTPPPVPPAAAAVEEPAVPKNAEPDQPPAARRAREGDAAAIQRPNIVVVLADDLGYGDVRCYDPEHAKVPTPSIDRLAEEGLRFTDAHTSASLCSPSRYGLLTGRFSWRTAMRTHVVRVYGSPLIAPDRLTLPRMLQQQGYRTACFGKWHLGWDWPLREKDGAVLHTPPGQFLQERPGEPVFELPIGQGPTTRGFDEYFGVDVPNLPPYTFLENDRMVAAPTERKTINDRVQWGPPGPMAPGWQFDRILPTIVDRTEDYIARRARDKQPFFVYMPLTTPHEPIAPSEPFRGKSGISDVADLILETDAALGKVMSALEKHGLAGNTLLIFTSDNGHCSYTGLAPFQAVGHRVGGPYRGYKCNISEGGHRVPLVVRWPGVVAPGRRCDQLVCLSDLMATCAEMLGVGLPDEAAEDSVSLLPLLRGEDRPIRRDLVHQCYSELLSIRQGPWKLALCAGDGTDRPWCKEEGVPHDVGEIDARQRGLPPIQLYNVVDDPGETKNLQAEHPEVVRRLHGLLAKYVSEGRSTPGIAQKNDVQVPLPALP